MSTNVPEPPESIPVRPVMVCPTSVCGMHPAHLCTRDGLTTHCPGNTD